MPEKPLKKPDPIKETPLREPPMPEVSPPEDFLQKIAQNRAEAENFENRVKALQGKKQR